MPGKIKNSKVLNRSVLSQLRSQFSASTNQKSEVITFKRGKLTKPNIIITIIDSGCLCYMVAAESSREHSLILVAMVQGV